jgi:ATP-binding protein involved in chromosome partitioning
VALADARKGIEMFKEEKVNVPVLGLVENMAWFTPAPHPDEKYYIFGEGGCSRLAQETNVPLLASIPLVADVSARSDSGSPVAGDTESNAIVGEYFRSLADKVVEVIDNRNNSLPPTQKVEMQH